MEHTTMTDSRPTEVLECRDCRCRFNFTTSEQRFFADKGFSPPIRCHDCRAARKRLTTAELADVERRFQANAAEGGSR